MFSQKILANEMSTARIKDYNEELKEAFVRIIAGLSHLELELLHEMHQGTHNSKTHKEVYFPDLEKKHSPGQFDRERINL